MPDFVHFTTPALLKNHQSACGLSARTNQVSSRTQDVTCLPCRASAPFLARNETAGPPAVKRPDIPAHMRLEQHADRTVCGLTERDRIEPDGRLIMPSWEYVTCPECLGLKAPEVRHFADSTTGVWTRCGVNHTRRVTPRTDLWALVTCPRCLIIHSREKETDMPEYDVVQGETAMAGPPSQDGITEEHCHDWEMVDGPKWPHDCEGCIYLGTKYHAATWDLYYCQQGGRPTVIARRGEAGDYESGIEFIDRIPMLALAYVRAVKAGLFHTSDLPGLGG